MVTDSTIGRVGGVLRLATDCNCWTRAVPITIGSFDWCGMAAWLPVPLTVMSKNEAPAMAGPGVTLTTPGAESGSLCIP